MGTVTVVVDGYWTRSEPPNVSSRTAKVSRRLRSRTPVRLYVYDTLLEQLAQGLQDMVAALGPCILQEHAVVRQRYFARHRHVAPADQPHIRDGVMEGATRAGRDPRRAVAGAARDAVDTRGLQSFGQTHRR
jgi:hypothetical protein